MADPRAELRAAAEKATGGPWRIDEGPQHARVWGAWSHDGVVAELDSDDAGRFDARFIAAASPDVVLALLNDAAEVAGLRAELAAARDDLRRMTDGRDQADASAVWHHDRWRGFRDQLADACHTLDAIDVKCSDAYRDVSGRSLLEYTRVSMAIDPIRELIAASRPSSPDTDNSSSGDLSERYFAELVALSNHPAERARIKARRDEYRAAAASDNSSDERNEAEAWRVGNKIGWHCLPCGIDVTFGDGEHWVAVAEDRVSSHRCRRFSGAAVSGDSSEETRHG